MAQAAYRRLVMLGTAPETHGGVAAMIGAYRAAGLFERWPIEYLATHRRGGAARKLGVALSAFARFAALLAAHRRVIVHVHCAAGASFWRKALFMALALAARCPVLLHLHGGDFAHFYGVRCGRLGRALVRALFARAAYLITPTERGRMWLTLVTGNPNLACVPSPVAPAAAHPPHPRRPLVLYLGRLDAAKGIPELLEAVAGLRAALPDVELVCAGEGDVAAAARQAALLGIEDAVRFLGWLRPAEKRLWLKRAAVFALPSHAEGLPYSLLEAMATGLPVVATAVGGIPDVVTDGVNGCLVAPGDAAQLRRALRRLLLDPGLAAQLGAAGRETIRTRCAPEQALAQLERLYADLGLVRRARAAPAFAVLRKAA